MVDRYFLPVPKSLNYGSYLFLKNWKLYFYVNFIGVTFLSFQIYRHLLQKRLISKPAGYYLDWGSPDAPKKIKHF